MAERQMQLLRDRPPAAVPRAEGVTADDAHRRMMARAFGEGGQDPDCLPFGAEDGE